MADTTSTATNGAGEGNSAPRLVEAYIALPRAAREDAILRLLQADTTAAVGALERLQIVGPWRHREGESRESTRKVLVAQMRDQQMSWAPQIPLVRCIGDEWWYSVPAEGGQWRHTHEAALEACDEAWRKAGWILIDDPGVDRHAGIEQALKSGRVIRGFSAGGGVRVLRDQDEDGYYGEGGTLSEAMRSLNASCTGTQRTDDVCVCGSDGPPESRADAILAGGGKVRMEWDGLAGVFVVELFHVADVRHPEIIQESAHAVGLARYTSARGVTYTLRSTTVCGGPALEVEASRPLVPGRANYWPVRQRGCGETLAAALLAASRAEEVEVQAEEEAK